MFDLTPTAAEKPALYRDLLAAIDAVMANESDPVANMANAAALLFEWLPDVNWVGFYRLIDGELVLGPFQGKVACIRIAIGQGVCGTAAAARVTQVVEDVDAFPGHIPCDAASRSEIVVPLIVDRALVGVLDIDSPTPSRFDDGDKRGCEAIAALLSPRICP
ncbi:MAG: GAF domain-containing protein [Sphingomonadaceae bacterium]|nr:GAF domain-containing protein [Sphingomonadaceae bacterium]